MSESSHSKENNAEENTVPPEKQERKLTPLEAIKQAQAARQHNQTSGGKRGGNKGQPFGQGGAAASRKPTTGRQSYGGNS